MRIMAKNHTATKEQRQAGAWRKRGTKSVGGGMLALTSAVVAAAMLATPAALAGGRNRPVLQQQAAVCCTGEHIIFSNSEQIPSCIHRVCGKAWLAWPVELQV